MDPHATPTLNHYVFNLALDVFLPESFANGTELVVLPLLVASGAVFEVF